MNIYQIRSMAIFIFAILLSFNISAQDNLGNHTATQNLNMNSKEIDNVKNVDIKAGTNNALRFWNGSNNYSMAMGNNAYYHYGGVTGYSIKTNMYNISGRGWTWGSYNKVPVAALTTTGTLQLKKSLFAMGEVGICTTTPSEKLHVQDGSVMVSSTGTFGDPEILFDDGNYTNNKGQWGIEYFSAQNGLNFFKGYPSPNFGNYKLFLHNNGNIGIGTGTPAYKLDVCGTIRSKEVRVETGWCDYVFEDDYELRSLEEVQSFIDKNKHLPDVPAGEDIETNGLKLAEMQATHMLKIEELTLYILEMNNQIKELKSQVESLNNSK